MEELELVFDDEWPEDNTRETKKALEKLKEAVDQVNPSLGSKDKAEMDKKLSDIKDKMDDVLKLFKDLNTAGKQIAQFAKSPKNVSPNLYGNLADLKSTLNDQAKKMKQIQEVSDHKPADNTVCEYLVMVNEACAAFSTFTNLFSKSIATIIVNIGLDKGAPDFALKEPAKIFAISKHAE